MRDHTWLLLISTCRLIYMNIRRNSILFDFHVDDLLRRSLWNFFATFDVLWHVQCGCCKMSMSLMGFLWQLEMKVAPRVTFCEFSPWMIIDSELSTIGDMWELGLRVLYVEFNAGKPLPPPPALSISSLWGWRERLYWVFMYYVITCYE